MTISYKNSNNGSCELLLPAVGGETLLSSLCFTKYNMIYKLGAYKEVFIKYGRGGYVLGGVCAIT